MTRRRYVYREVEPGKVEAFEVDLEWKPTDFAATHKSEEEIYGKAVATDGTDISTKRRFRNYMKATGAAHASDYSPAFMEKKQAERAKAFTPGAGYDRERRREAIVDSMHRLNARRRKL